MKRSLIGSLTLFAFATLVVVSAPRAALAQTTTFTVTVPNRAAPLLPVAQVKIWLNVTAPSNSDTLTVTHSSGLRTFGPHPTFSRTVPDAPGVRNRVKFKVFPAENRVEIILFPEGNLLDVGGVTRYCQLSASPSFDSWQFSYTNAGGNVATSFRFNSFTAAAASGLGCDCNNRRIGDAANPSVITFSSPSVPPSGQRFPVDLVFVLDRSGSMTETIPMSSPAVVKMDKLHTSMGALIDAWRMFGGPDEDRLAVVWFESLTEIENPPGGFAKRVPASGATWEDIRDDVVVKTTANMTAMGDGITEAFNIHQAIPEAERSDLFIILLTDGMQNEGRLILPGNSPEVTAANTAAGVPPLTQEALAFWDETLATDQYVYLAGKCAPVQAVGVGAPEGGATSFAALLDDIAAETGGKVDINLGTNMDTALLNAVIDSVKGNTLTKVVEVDTTLAASSPSAAPAEFELSSAVSRATIVLSWDAPPSGLELEIRRPDNTTFTVPAAQRRDNPRYTVQTIDLPANGPPGRWTATVRRAGGNSAATPYHLNVVAAEDRLAFNMSFAQADHGTGEPIVLTASLSDRGVPVTGLGGSISVRVRRPQSALGSLLRSRDVPQSVLTTDPAGSHQDTTRNSPYARKLFHLMKDPSFLALVGAQQDARTFTLFDDGNPSNGDARAGDGVYSMRYSGDDTRTPGLYTFDLTMNFDRPSLGRIVRTEERETDVRVKVADPGETEIASTRTPTPGEFRVDVTPADRFGNFMGPGYPDRVRLTLSGGGTVTGPVDERQNGTYTFRVTGVPSCASTTGTLAVNGGTVKTFNLCDDTPTKRWSVFAAIGANAPHGDFDAFLDSGPSVSAGLEFRFTNRVGVEGMFGYDRFNTPFGSNPSLYHLSGNVKAYPVVGAFQLGVSAGGGVYVFDPGGDARFGLNLGVAPEFRITTSFGLEGRYNFHNVFTPGSQLRYSTVQGGVRFRF